MFSPNTILCIDFDGTLIDSQVRMLPADVEKLKHFPENIQPVINTGRDLLSVKSILQQNGLFEDIAFSLPGVFMNGGAAYRLVEVICQ